MSSTAIPLGAVIAADKSGVHFSVFSSAAESVELCLFGVDRHEKTRVPLAKGDDDIWRVFVPGTAARICYGYRVHGPHDPARGLFSDAERVLLDPYARAIKDGLGIVTDDAFDWQGDTLPRTPFAKTVIYEAHVRGLTMNFPGVPQEIRGTYAALSHTSVIQYLKDLGVTTLELLPVHAKSNDRFLTEKGLTNYWGYSTLNFFSPEPDYAHTDAVQEFKTMVKALHRAGIEVILDVVYNHTSEMGADGPLLSLRGFDNRAYYLFEEGRGFIDHTGCGNTLNLAHPQARRLVLDSLRYWAGEMHVDGFRFDLAPALFRAGGDPTMDTAFARELMADPVLSQLKLIAEPWDLGPGGYARYLFGEPWREWNDRFRNAARRFWRGDADVIHDLRREMVSERAINYVTCHDGFTLRDLVSFERKHNDANRENNRDGTDENFSANYGVEGESIDDAVVELRRRQSRNLIATLLFARATPMLLAGDELGHSQRGNNNAYCQDNEITHLTWDSLQLRDFLRECLHLRARFDWDKAVFTEISVENSHALGFEIRFPEDRRLVFIVNASSAAGAVFTLPPCRAGFAERIHTSRATLSEAVAEICVAAPRSLVLLEAL